MTGRRQRLTAAWGDVTTGQWCDRCLLPSAFTADVLLLAENGVSLMGTLQQCVQCGFTRRVAR